MTDQELIDSWGSGLTTQQIASKFGLSTGTVANKASALRKAGIELERRAGGMHSHKPGCPCRPCSGPGTKYENYRARHPEKIRARSAVSQALRTGKLQRLPCAICGDTEVEAHHHDYSKPLDIKWLCQQHHREEHSCV